MRSPHQWRVALIVTVFLAIAVVPIEDELGRRLNLGSVPTPVLVGIALTVCALLTLLGDRGRMPSERSLIRGVNKHSRLLAEHTLDEARSSTPTFFDLFGPVDGYGQPVIHAKDVLRRRIVLAGPAGCGKTVALARVAGKLCESADRPVFYGHASDIWPAGWTARPGALDQALIAALQQRGVSASLAQEWLDDASLVVLIDGLNEAPYDVDLIIQTILQHVRKYPDATVVVVWRIDDGQTISSFETWTMPSLPKRLVRRELQAVPAYRHAPESVQAQLEQACTTPLLLAMVREAPADFADRFARATYAQLPAFIVESAVRSRLGWEVAGPISEEAAFARWLARAMGKRSLGTTLELRSMAWQLLPSDVQRVVRALSLFVIGVPVFVCCSVLGVGLGLGPMGIAGSIVYIIVLFGIGNMSPLGTRYVRNRRWEIVARRTWSVYRVAYMSRGSRRWLIRRSLQGVAVGIPVGLAFYGLVRLTANSIGGTGWFIWIALAAIPTLVGLFGAMIGGLMAGAVGGAAFGMDPTFIDAIVGGATAGGTAALFFSLIDFGDVRTPPDVSAPMEQLFRALATSAWQQTRFDVTVWIAYGAFYGGVNWLTHGGGFPWLAHGLATGAAGAVFYGSTALVGPVAAYVVADFGLRRSGLLHAQTLNQMLAQLAELRLLQPAGRGAAFRFAHPLVGEFLAEEDPELGGSGDHRPQGRTPAS